MPQPTFRRPLDEAYLRHQLRPDPLHLPHLVGRHATTQRDDFEFGRSTKGQSSTWCGFSALRTSRRR